MKVLKVAGLALGGVLGLAILAAIALLLFVDPNRYRGSIEARVREATGRPVTIDGTIKLKLFPWLALDIGKVTVGNPDGFGATPILAVDHAQVGARLLPLVRGQLEVSRVALDGLALNLIRRADGHTNWEDLFRGGSTAAGTPLRLADVSVAGLDLRGATLTLRDDGKRSLARIRDLELHTGALGLDRPTDLSLAARADTGDGTAAIRLELKARATLDTGHSMATLSAVNLIGERVPTEAGAKPTPFSVASAQVALDWKNGALAPATLEFHLGEFALSAEVSAEALYGARVVSGRARLNEQSPRKVAASLGAQMPASRDPAAFSRVSGAFGFRLTEHALTLDGVDLALDRSHLRGQLAIEDLAKPVIDVDLSADAIDLDSYRAPAARPAAGAKSAVATPLPVAALQALNARGNVSLQRATLAGLALSDVHIAFTAIDGDVYVKPSAKAFSGTVAGVLHLDATHEQVTLSLTGNLRSVDIGAAFKSYANSDRLSGRANAEARLTGGGTTDAALMASLAGPIDFDVQDGAVEGIDVTYEIERAQSLLQGQAPPPRSGPAHTPFNVLSSRSQLGRGVLATDPLRLETAVLKVSGKGTLRLADQAVDYQIIARLEQVPARFTALKSLEIPIAVTGTVHDYKVRPDLAGIAKGRIKQELEQHKEELRDKLRDQLRNLLPH
jgi:AsmA protein